MNTSATQQPAEKRCTRCRDSKPLDRFHKAASGASDGKQSWCHDCQVEFTRERRARIRQDAAKYLDYLEQRRAEKRRYRARRKLRALTLLDNLA